MVDHKTGKPLPFGSLGIHKVHTVHTTWREYLCVCVRGGGLWIGRILQITHL